MEKRLYRDELNKQVAGVCSGLAQYLNMDVSVVRAIFLIGLFVKGATFIPYIVLWIVLPKKPYHLNNLHNVTSRARRAAAPMPPSLDESLTCSMRQGSIMDTGHRTTCGCYLLRVPPF